jgi:hypothetical protein
VRTKTCGYKLKLVFHPEEIGGSLDGYYVRAFKNAIELYVVSAYLTKWDSSLVLNSACRQFKFIVGKDFGITRKAACLNVLKWLPKQRSFQFLVAAEIQGFHPKAVFWKEQNGTYHVIVGSSNLTRAAFSTNHEANVYSKIPAKDFANARTWVNKIEQFSMPVSEDWLDKYIEAKPSHFEKTGNKNRNPAAKLPLPRPRGTGKVIEKRSEQMAAFSEIRQQLTNLFKQSAKGAISNPKFLERLRGIWGTHRSRFQGKGWERTGSSSDFKLFSQALLTVLKNPESIRDEIVAEQIDNLLDEGVTTRGALFSEMLCHFFPHLYPVLNGPVTKWRMKAGLRPPRGASQGAKYIDLAKKLRIALLLQPGHPAKNLAELDAVIWLSENPGQAQHL